MIAFEELLKLWEPYRGLTMPPVQTVTLWSAGGCGIFISNEWGPAVPYGPVDHGNGAKNHGYLRLKDDLSRVGQIPEAENWPELQRFLEALNAPSSPIESAGCEKGFFPGEGQSAPPVLLGSYIDVIFTNAALNDRPENPLLLASRLAQAVDGCEKWWAEISFVLQRNRALMGAATPWGLMLHIKNHGRSEEEARKLWDKSLDLLAKAVESLPPGFACENELEQAG